MSAANYYICDTCTCSSNDVRGGSRILLGRVWTTKEWYNWLVRSTNLEGKYKGQGSILGGGAYPSPPHHSPGHLYLKLPWKFTIISVCENDVKIKQESQGSKFNLTVKNYDQQNNNLKLTSHKPSSACMHERTKITKMQGHNIVHTCLR